jgi:hypothetical protein
MAKMKRHMTHDEEFEIMKLVLDNSERKPGLWLVNISSRSYNTPNLHVYTHQGV